MARRSPTPTLDFAGRKLVGLIVCTGAMVVTAIGTLGLGAAKMLDGAFSQNLTITVVGGIATLYATFCGANYGEWTARKQRQAPCPPQADKPAPPREGEASPADGLPPAAAEPVGAEGEKAQG
jgi:hypothetical protein